MPRSVPDPDPPWQRSCRGGRLRSLHGADAKEGPRPGRGRPGPFTLTSKGGRTCPPPDSHAGLRGRLHLSEHRRAAASTPFVDVAIAVVVERGRADLAVTRVDVGVVIVAIARARRPTVVVIVRTVA